MHYLAFDKNWFSKHQKGLLWLLRFKLFRKILRIECDERILEITPNSYTIHVSGNEFKTDFRTHWKYSKRLYFAFKPIWWVIHFWDWLIADRFIPQWSYGFLTLTAYPDPDPETTTVDGFVRTDPAGSTWAAIRTDTVNASAGPSSANGIMAGFQRAAGGYDKLVRSIFLFDTSSLTSGATISDAILSLSANTSFNSTGLTPEINIYTSTPASNTDLVAGDYVQVGTTAQSTSKTYTTWSSATGYKDFTLNATGLSNISKTSITKFGARESLYDAANSDPGIASGTAVEFQGDFADTAGTSDDPKLVVTYTLGGVRLLSLLGVGT